MIKHWAITALTSVFILAAPALASVKTQILEVDVKLSSQQVTEVKVHGFVRNHNELTVRDTHVKVQLLDPNNKVIRSFFLPTYDQIRPGMTHQFQASQTLHESPHAFVKARAQVDYKSITYLQIADWVSAQNWDKLSLWNLPVTHSLKTSETERVNQALGYLTRIEMGHPLYSEARRKWNLLQYNDAQRLILKKLNHEAMLRLANVEPHSKYYAQAQALSENHREHTIYHRALLKAKEGNLRGAYRQILYLPELSKYSVKAEAHKEKWLEEIKEKRIWMGHLNAPSHLSRDQKKVWLRRSHGPEGYTTSQQKNGQKLTTWWYLDYSHYTFNAQGRLVDSKVY